MMPTIPKSLTWTGYGKSRLSKVSYPDVYEEVVNNVEQQNDDEFDVLIDDIYMRMKSHPLALHIRTPVSIKQYKRSQPILIVRKRKPVKYDV